MVEPRPYFDALLVQSGGLFLSALWAVVIRKRRVTALRTESSVLPTRANLFELNVADTVRLNVGLIGRGLSRINPKGVRSCIHKCDSVEPNGTLWEGRFPSSARGWRSVLQSALTPRSSRASTLSSDW